MIKIRTFNDLFKKCTIMSTDSIGVFEISCLFYVDKLYVHASIFATNQTDKFAIRSCMAKQFDSKREFGEYFQTMETNNYKRRFVNIDLNLVQISFIY